MPVCSVDEKVLDVLQRLLPHHIVSLIAIFMHLYFSALSSSPPPPLSVCKRVFIALTTFGVFLSSTLSLYLITSQFFYTHICACWCLLAVWSLVRELSFFFLLLHHVSSSCCEAVQMSSSGPIRDYYKESRKRAVVPAACPLCHHRGVFVANLYEVGKRIHRVMAEGLCYCHSCHKPVMGGVNALEKRIWICAPCEICLCAACHEKAAE